MSDFKMKLANLYLQKKMDGADIVDYIDAITVNENVEFVNSTEKDCIRIATVLLEKKKYKDISQYLEHINYYIKQGAEAKCEFISLPQLVGMLPLKMVPGYLSTEKEAEHLTDIQSKREYIVDLIDTMGSWLMEVYVNTYCSFSKKYNITIHAGSILVIEKGKLYNRSYIFNPEGDIVLAQDKLYLSQVEKDWGISAGNQINIALTSIGSVTVFNDRDCLYYENFKIAREMGAKLILFSHISNNIKEIKTFIEALSWRSDEQGIYIAESGYFNSDTAVKSHIICPTSISKKNSGILFFSEEKGVHVCTLTYSKLKNSYDTYSTDKNSNFYKKVMPQIYNKRIK